MANSISGNAGVAGAIVQLVNYSATPLTVAADSSGNYSFTGLSAGIYYLMCDLQGYTFSPVMSMQILVASDITGVNFTPAIFQPANNWGVWSKTYNTIPTITGGGVQPGAALYEAGAQILAVSPTTPVFKTWFMDGTTAFSPNVSIYYAESLDGLTWSRKTGAVIADQNWNTIFKNGSTYYAYTANGTPGLGEVYTSPDGINFTPQGAIFTSPGAGHFDSSGIYQFSVVEIVAGVWHAIYTGGATNGLSLGYATSVDGINWLRGNGGNPVFANGSAQNVLKVGSTYYCWFNYSPGFTQVIGGAWSGTQTNIYRMQSTDLINWTNLIPSLPRSEYFEAPLNIPAVNGQTGNPAIVETNGKTYMFYMGTTNAAAGNGTGFTFNTAIAPMPLATLVQTNEGVAKLQILTAVITETQSTPVTTISTPAFPTIPGSALIVFFRPNTTSITGLGITDLAPSGGNSFSQVSTHTPGAPNNGKGVWFICNNCKGQANNVVTANWTGGSAYDIICAWQIPNVPATGLTFDADVSNQSGSSGTMISTALNTAYTNEIILGGPAYSNGTLADAISPAVTDIRLAPATQFASGIGQIFNSKQTGATIGAARDPSSGAQTSWALYANAFGIGAIIAGNAGLAGVTITYTGAASGSTTTDSAGDYLISGLADGSYTITPFKTGYIFSPTSASETVSGADITGVNFTAIQNTYGSFGENINWSNMLNWLRHV